MMKVARDKKKRKIDDNDNGRSATALEGNLTTTVRGGILKPTSHASSSFPRHNKPPTLQTDGDEHMDLTWNDNNNESTSGIDMARNDRQYSLKSNIPLENTLPEKRRVAFQNDVIVNFIPGNEDKVYKDCYVEDDAGQLDDFFQSIDEIATSCDEKSNLKHRETAIFNQSEIAESASLDKYNEDLAPFINKRKITENIDSNNDGSDGESEQAAYEARLARLILLRSHHNHAYQTVKHDHVEQIINPIIEYMPSFTYDTLDKDYDQYIQPASVKDMIRNKFIKKSKFKASEIDGDDSYWSND